jgi:hypothetical protein
MSAHGTFRTCGAKALLREPHTTHEFRKSRIGTQRAPARIKAQPDEPMRPLVEGPVEVRECGVVLTKAGMHERNSIRRHEPAARHSFQLGEYFPGFIGAAGSGGDEASRRNRNGPLAEQFLDSSEFCKGIVETSQFLESPP